MGELEHENEMAIVLPEWTHDDFLTEEPYRWLFKYRDSQFTLQRLLARAGDAAKAQNVNVKDFQKMWKLYECERVGRTQVVGNYVTEFSGQPTQLVAGIYRCEDDGVSRIDEKGRTVEVISHPIMPIGRVCNIEDGTVRIWIAWKLSGKSEWRQYLFLRESLASKRKIVECLAPFGIRVNDVNAGEVVRFLSELESRNYNELPVQSAVNRLGWIDNKTFVPYSKDVVFSGDESFAGLFRGFSERGTLDGWIKFVEEIRNGGEEMVAVRILIAASFASPLLEPLGIPAFWVHLWGEKDLGKTLALALAASVWGQPDKRKADSVVKGMNATDNSHEFRDSFLRHLPNFLDELQSATGGGMGERDFSQLIYKHCEGVSKGRGTKQGGLWQEQTWRNVAFSTGERPITSATAQSGSLARTIEIQQKVAIPAKWYDMIEKEYGTAGPAFIQGILQDEDSMEQAKGRLADLVKELGKCEVDGKQALAAAVVLVADELAERYIFRDGIKLSTDQLLPYLRTNEETDINMRAYVEVQNLLAANIARFQIFDDVVPNDCWGKKEEEKDGTHLYINVSVLRKWFTDRGWSYQAFIDWAKKRGVVADHSTGKDRHSTRRRRINGVSTTVIDYRSDAEVDEEDEEDLPF